LPNFRVSCSFSANTFLEGLGTDDFLPDDDFWEPIDTAAVFGGFEVLEETSDPVGCSITEPKTATPPDAAATVEIDQSDESARDEPMPDGVVIAACGECELVLEAADESDITDELVLAALPKRCVVGELENYSYELDPSI
jgi:hypothetical protein